ncbi:MAG: YdcH family protein [Pseudomonadota bacterium]
MPEIERWENEGGGLSPPRRAARLQALQRRHAHLDKLVQTELKRPAPCAVELQRLRREKLYLRDEMRTLAT